MAGDTFLSKLLERTDVLGITGMSCSGKPGTKAPTVAVAPGTGPADADVSGAFDEDDAEAGEEGAAVEESEEFPDADGAAGLLVGGVQAETARATLAASRANPRDRGVPKSFTGVSFLGLTGDCASSLVSGRA